MQPSLLTIKNLNINNYSSIKPCPSMFFPPLSNLHIVPFILAIDDVLTLILYKWAFRGSADFCFISSIDSNWVSFEKDLILGKRNKPQGAKSSDYGAFSRTVAPLSSVTILGFCISEARQAGSVWTLARFWND